MTKNSKLALFSAIITIISPEKTLSYLCWKQIPDMMNLQWSHECLQVDFMNFSIWSPGLGIQYIRIFRRQQDKYGDEKSVWKLVKGTQVDWR